MAGRLGFEPRSTVLETVMLPIAPPPHVVLRDRVELSSRDYKSRALTTELAEYGASDRNRTCNLLITNQLRCQLRHRSKWRRGRDLNSRNPFRFGGLAIHCTRPLCDLSMVRVAGLEPARDFPNRFSSLLHVAMAAY